MAQDMVGICWGKPSAGRGQREGQAASDMGAQSQGAGGRGRIPVSKDLWAEQVLPWRKESSRQGGNTGTQQKK